MKTIWIFAAALALLVFSASAPVPAQAQAETENGVLRPGDMVMIHFPGEPGFDEPLQIDRKGRLELPEAGFVAVAGQTAAEAEILVKTALGRAFRNAGELTLEVAGRRLSVTVLGFVNQPGPVDLPGDAGVQMAISAAGGLTEGAQLDRMQVRRGAEVLSFNYKEYLDTGDTELLPQLRPLDVVFAPASPLMGNVQVDLDPHEFSPEERGRGTSIHVLGEVAKPGAVGFKPNMTFLDALSAAGGPKTRADLHNLAVTRPETEGAGVTRVNLAQYFQTGDESLLPELGPGDVVYIPERGRAYISVKRENTVRVLGAVLRPGRYAFADDLTVLDLLAQAGGPTNSAYIEKITVTAAGGEDSGSQTFDLDAFAESGDAAALPAVNAGDTIYVPNEKEDPTFQFRQTLRDAVSIITIGSLAFGG